MRLKVTIFVMLSIAALIFSAAAYKHFTTPKSGSDQSYGVKKTVETNATHDDLVKALDGVNFSSPVPLLEKKLKQKEDTITFLLGMLEKTQDKLDSNLDLLNEVNKSTEMLLFRYTALVKENKRIWEECNRERATKTSTISSIGLYNKEWSVNAVKELLEYDPGAFKAMTVFLGKDRIRMLGPNLVSGTLFTSTSEQIYGYRRICDFYEDVTLDIERARNFEKNALSQRYYLSHLLSIQESLHNLIVACPECCNSQSHKKFFELAVQTWNSQLEKDSHKPH